MGRAQAPFRTETRLVVLQATVKNERGELVTDLDRGAFAVYENGKKQPISVFRRDDIPVSLGLLIDNSGSMRLKRARVEAAALALVAASNPHDEVFVLNFADKPRLDVPFTSDVKVLQAGIARVDSIGGTAMRDAIDMAEGYLHDHGTRDRKALLIVSDGEDNSSVASLDQVQTRAEQDGVVVYAVGLLSEEASSKVKHARHDLDRLTETTGGVAYYPDSLEKIDGVALDLARQIRNQYTIGYTPLNQALDGTYRKLRVEVTGRERLTVRTRAGYRATPRPS
ncbi:MAG TPA: VWA domain-containing protein [Vicinamibacterales bacterium]|nr:VWA domain-containing protein [Vicinamibacterales bacterium]